MSYLVFQSTRLGEEKAGSFTFNVFLMPYGCYCSLSLPYDVVGWSALCDCGFSWSYSLTFFISRKLRNQFDISGVCVTVAWVDLVCDCGIP